MANPVFTNHQRGLARANERATGNRRLGTRPGERNRAGAKGGRVNPYQGVEDEGGWEKARPGVHWPRYLTEHSQLTNKL